MTETGEVHVPESGNGSVSANGAGGAVETDGARGAVFTDGMNGEVAVAARPSGRAVPKR